MSTLGVLSLINPRLMTSLIKGSIFCLKLEKFDIESLKFNSKLKFLC